MISDQWQIENYDKSGNIPQAWEMSADSLLAAEGLLRKERTIYYTTTAQSIKAGQEIPPEGKILNVEIMLKGFAVECLLKALWVKKGNELAHKGKLHKIPGVGDHKLIQLAKKMELQIDEKQTSLLRRLEIYVASMGRYPMGVNWETTKITKASGGPPTCWSVPSDDLLFDRFIGLVQEEIDKSG
jgi:hypothetical protein